MKYGPFPELEAKQIEKVLFAKGIPFERVHSEELVKNWRTERNLHLSAYPSFNGLIANVFIEISESDVVKLGTDLEKFGIIAAGDGDHELSTGEELFCPKCDFVSDAPRLCPKHQVRLMSLSEKAQMGAGKSKMWSMVFLIFFIVLILWRYLHSAF